MKFIGFKVEEETAEKIKELAKQDERKTSELIRKIVKEYIKEKEEKENEG